MDWAIFWTAAGVIVAASIPLLIWHLDRRRERSTMSEFSMEGSSWVLAQGMTYEDLLRQLLSLDRAALAGLSDLSSGNEFTKAEVFEKSQDTWSLVVFRDSIVVGYWSYFSLSDHLIKRIEKGLMYDSEITPNEVHCITEARDHSLYFEMFGIHPGFRKSERTIFKMLLTSLESTAATIRSGRLRVKAVYATGFSSRGAALCRAFGLECLVKSAQGGDVYRTTDVTSALQRLETLCQIRRIPG
jgi:hypothetical protein